MLDSKLANVPHLPAWKLPFQSRVRRGNTGHSGQIETSIYIFLLHRYHREDVLWSTWTNYTVFWICRRCQRTLNVVAGDTTVTGQSHVLPGPLLTAAQAASLRSVCIPASERESRDTGPESQKSLRGESPWWLLPPPSPRERVLKHISNSNVDCESKIWWCDKVKNDPAPATETGIETETSPFQSRLRRELQKRQPGAKQ